MEMYPRFSEHKSYFNYTLKPTLKEPAGANLGYQWVSVAEWKDIVRPKEDNYLMTLKFS